MTGDITDEDLVPARRTKLGLYVTSKDACEAWRSDRRVRILDVRSPQEYVFVGHAEMAVNIPLAASDDEWDPSTASLRWVPNVAFVGQVSEWAGPSDTIMVTCRSGGRSAMAVNALASAGFTNVHNIVDGFEGDKVTDPASMYVGQRMSNGWRNSGLPWTYDVNPDQMRMPERPAELA